MMAKQKKKKLVKFGNHILINCAMIMEEINITKFKIQKKVLKK
jgi:hypothetical protein